VSIPTRTKLHVKKMILIFMLLKYKERELTPIFKTCINLNVQLIVIHKITIIFLNLQLRIALIKEQVSSTYLEKGNPMWRSLIKTIHFLIVNRNSCKRFLQCKMKRKWGDFYRNINKQLYSNSKPLRFSRLMIGFLMIRRLNRIGQWEEMHIQKHR